MREPFFSEQSISLKVCGVTQQSDAETLVDMGVPALGFNFWPSSKRYLAAENAAFLKALGGRVLRFGVFVNAPIEQPRMMLEQGWLDYAQFHGDEDLLYCKSFASSNLPYIRAVAFKDGESIEPLELPGCSAILLDAHAPGLYGGTGEKCDWSIVPQLKIANPDLPIVLAGGINCENVGLARQVDHIVALDVASGSESSAGIKDFSKVEKLLEC